jgi:uncharacterized DUF497 family protein
MSGTTTRKRSISAGTGSISARPLSLKWERSIVWQDLRRDYGERRYLVLAKIAGRVHLMAFTPRGGYLRIISLRKANRREVRRYEKEV